MNKTRDDNTDEILGLVFGLLPFGLLYMFGIVGLCALVGWRVAKSRQSVDVIQNNESLCGSRNSSESSVRAPGAESDTTIDV